MRCDNPYHKHTGRMPSAVRRVQFISTHTGVAGRGVRSEQWLCPKCIITFELLNGVRLRSKKDMRLAGM